MKWAKLLGIVKHSEEALSWYLPSEHWPPVLIQRFLDRPSKIKFKSGDEFPSACLKCCPAPCFKYSSIEIMCPDYKDVPDDVSEKVCPTGALTIADQGYPFVDHEICVKCNICVLRCPVGALYWNASNELTVITEQTYAQERHGPREKAEEETLRWKSALIPKTSLWEIDSNWIRTALELSQTRILGLNLRRDSYYPLVRNYFRQLGFKANLGRSGDTAWRFDCITLEPIVMPIEIKSPSEKVEITPDAARQAIENSAIIESRFKYEIKPTSIVVGCRYPSHRSDVRKALVDVKNSFGASIGLYTTGVLHYLLLRHVEYNFNTEDFRFLFEQTLGSCEISDVKDFWTEYIKQRLEVVIFKDNSPRYNEYGSFMPHHKSIHDLERNTLILLWEKEWEILESLSDLLFTTK